MTYSSQGIAVDLAQLRDICKAFGLDTEQGLRPGLSRADQKIHQGVPFGRRSPSGEADAAARALIYVLKRYAHNNVSHLRCAEQISTFLDNILDAYADTDAISALGIESVIERLNEALPPVSPHQSATGAQP
ncbi:hypothetical protein [Allorhizocola rhizosphaerae]|uniref:hypothetical protein n=1 Tax=Allorhizocola rhizosphaerae TaxID=1872709 RepID=UPI0013C2A5B3|nr:hypothetical protein [Allorhizocola rhizosphaerae]